MRSCEKSLRVLAAISIYSASLLTVQAAPVTVGFTVTANSGPLSGTSSTGTLSYDDGIVTPSLTVSGPNLITGLDFSWNSVLYDESTANTGSLSFDELGKLNGALFGTNCVHNYVPTCSAEDDGDWWVRVDTLNPSISDFVYNAGGTAYSENAASLTSVPEPGTMVLILLGCAGIGFARKRLPA